MPDIGLSPLMVPYGADRTVYLVVDSIETGGAYREIEVERSDLERLISDLITGQFSAPVRVIAFNTLEHWSEDISKKVAEEIRTLCDIEGIAVPEHIRDFVACHIGPTRQPALCG